MSELRIRNFPDALRRRLQAEARKHRRSLDGEIVDLLEKGLALRARAGAAEGAAAEGAGSQPFLLTRRWLDDVKRRGQAVRLSELSRRA
jgi:plasmid stability protein